MAADDVSLEGGCTCGAVRYRLTRAPIFVHCCHCRWCQRETGSAFVINAMVEAENVQLLKGAPHAVMTPSNSGKGQKVLRCPDCQVALWSTYAGAGEAIRFLRVGTLDEPDQVPPDIHIFTSSKQPWVILPSDKPVFPEYYDRKQVWPAEALARGKAAVSKGRVG